MSAADYDSVGRPLELPFFEAAAHIHIEVCPAGRIWLVKSVTCQFISDGTAGNRLFFVRLSNSLDNTVFERGVGAVQAASLTRFYGLGPGMDPETAFVGGGLVSPMPETLLGPLGTVRVGDQNNISPAGDSVSGNISVIEFAVSQLTA